VTKNKKSDVVDILLWLASLAPTRLTGTPDEKRVQEAIAARLSPLGYRTDWQPFRFPRHIYGSLALHFGLALVFAAIGLRAPWVAAAGHVLCAASFVSEAAFRQHFLRALWPKVSTQNLLVTKPARSGVVKKRVVLAAHVDSAFTGVMFEPAMVKLIAAPPPSFLPFLQKQLALPLACVLLLAAYEVSRFFVPQLPAWPLAVLCIPPTLVFVLNADVVLRNRVVPGAADNLTGCAAQIVLAEEWAELESDDTEIVFAFTGAEEAGTGGAAHLARTMSAVWERDKTVVLVLDTLSNGTLFMLEEGELRRRQIPADLAAAVRTAALDIGALPPAPYVIPAGATDALPFLVEGYRAIALTCIDPELHAPRNYHHPNDTAERVDPMQLRESMRLATSLLGTLAPSYHAGAGAKDHGVQLEAGLHQGQLGMPKVDLDLAAAAFESNGKGAVERAFTPELLGGRALLGGEGDARHATQALVGLQGAELLDGIRDGVAIDPRAKADAGGA
jgi:hypothetical protein